jgi:hypothetical protein
VLRERSRWPGRWSCIGCVSTTGEAYAENEVVQEDGRKSSGALPHPGVIDVLEAKGRLPMQDFLRRRVVDFCDGVVFWWSGVCGWYFQRLWRINSRPGDPQPPQMFSRGGAEVQSRKEKNITPRSQRLCAIL